MFGVGRGNHMDPRRLSKMRPDSYAIFGSGDLHFPSSAHRSVRSGLQTSRSGVRVPQRHKFELRKPGCFGVSWGVTLICSRWGLVTRRYRWCVGRERVHTSKPAGYSAFCLAETASPGQSRESPRIPGRVHRSSRVDRSKLELPQRMQRRYAEMALLLAMVVRMSHERFASTRTSPTVVGHRGDALATTYGPPVRSRHERDRPTLVTS